MGHQGFKRFAAGSCKHPDKSIAGRHLGFRIQNENREKYKRSMRKEKISFQDLTKKNLFQFFKMFSWN